MDPNSLPRVNPSKLGDNCWIGTPVPGESMTQEQFVTRTRMLAKIAENRRRYHLPETYTVKQYSERAVSNRSFAPECYVCPVVSCNKERTRISVIAPNGQVIWTNWKHA